MGLVVLTAWIAAAWGCGGRDETAKPAPEKQKSRPAAASDNAAEGDEPNSGVEAGSRHADDWPTPGSALVPQAKSPRSFADLMNVPHSVPTWIPNLPRRRIDEAQAAEAGIRKLTGKHLTLFTDLESDDEVDALPDVFDQAFSQWCEYFDVDPIEHSDWSMTGFLMRDKQLFVRTGLLPDSLPPFQHGYARNTEWWVYEKPSPYYRRHLVLHEGTHGFMNRRLGATGPPWYSEGLAEMMATHSWRDGVLTMGWMPQSREDVPRLGRINIIQDALAAGPPKQLREVLNYGARAHLDREPYAWCWAAVTLMDRHPKFRDRFRGLKENVTAGGFNQRFYRLLGDDFDELAEQWQVFIHDLEYDCDVPRTIVDFSPGGPLPQRGARVSVAADRGWQNSGLRLESGVTYRLRATGRYQVADEPRIWWCEPGGVTIRYHQGRPLGMLLAALRPDPPPPDEPSAFTRPAAIGLGTVLTPSRSGTLHFKVNDSSGELDDNAGSLTVEIDKSPPPTRP